jgi:CelD/BcsL family acetyltransferase involved in cellulose biosynthesis
MDQPRVFYTWEWALAVQRAYSDSLRPVLFLAYDEQESLRGVAALASDPEGGQVSFLCATTGDYCDFLSSPEDKPALVTGVLAELRKQGIGAITLTNLPADSDSVAAIHQASAKDGYRYFARTAYVCAQVLLSKLRWRPGENKLVLPRKKMLRRFLNAMGREAPVRLDHARSWDTVEPLLPQFIQAHVARFLLTGRISNLVRPERRAFLEELAKLLCDRGWLALTRMMSGEDVFAWNYGFRFQHTWFWYQPTFDSALEKYSPGFCLLAKLVEEAADEPELEVVDLGLGAEDYKDRFCNHTRKTLCVTLTASAFEHFREIFRYRLSAALKAWPLAERTARSLLVSYKALKQRLHDVGLRRTCIWAAKRAQRAIVSRDEVFFYELTNPDPALLELEGVLLNTIDLNTLAAAAMQNANDEGTLAYLLRCSERLQREPLSLGFALTNRAGDFLHFTWAGPFEGFYWSELNSSLPSPAPDSVILFDSWTPSSQRGRGYYAPTLGLVASRIRQGGKRAWGFSASTNTSSVRGLEKAGFRRCLSVFRYRLLWRQKIAQKKAAVPSFS